MTKIKIHLTGKKNQNVKTIITFKKNKKSLKLGTILPYKKITSYDYNNTQKLIKSGNLISLSLIHVFLQNINI